MASNLSSYEYNSQLPFMFQLARSNSDSVFDKRGLTLQQAQLWGLVCKSREQVLADENLKGADPAIQQYTLEFWVWGKIRPEVKFPGVYPTQVYSPDVLPNPVSSGIVNVSTTYMNPSSSSLIQQFAVQAPTEDSLRVELRAAILAYKGARYVPFHGWDQKTGLPYYALICTATNGFRAFCGRDQEYFKQVRTHFYPTARVMFQRAHHGLMVIWMEATTYEHTIMLNSDDVAWNTFRAGWAFFKNWCDTYAGREAENIARCLEDWKAAGEVVLDGVELERPSCPLPPNVVVVGDLKVV